MRTFIFIIISILFTGCKHRIPEKKDPIKIAWHHEFGKRPVYTPDLSHNPIGFTTKNRTKRGIPLGGIGAGNFMYNICGSFGPFYMKAGAFSEHFLPQAAFHVYENVDGETQVKTLATEDVLPAWQRVNGGDGDYAALFPRGWCSFDCFSTLVSLRFFSPIIKNNYRETSYPVAVFIFKLKNTGEKPVDLSVMFTFPNSPFIGLPDTVSIPENKGFDYRVVERKGLYNKYINHTHYSSIVMSCNSDDNTPEAQGTEWCIASLPDASYTEQWNGFGDGLDIWSDFSDNGILDKKITTDSTRVPSGALAVKVTLKPGEENEIPFILSWYFPYTTFGAGTTWLKRFTEYYPLTSGRSDEIAAAGISDYLKWEEAINDWTMPVINNPKYPDWLKQGALNELYYTTFGGSFWENGCVTKDKKFGNRPGQHIASCMEYTGYRFCETFDVRHHNSLSYRLLWPDIERDILLMYADIIMDSPDGSCPHDAGGPDNDPFFEYDHYGIWYNNNPGFGIKGRITTPWSEFSPKFIQQTWAYYYLTKDESFLKEVWPAIVRTYQYQKTTDLDNDGVTDMKSSEYRENKLFNAVLWLGALQCMMETEKVVGDNSVHADIENQLNLCLENIEKRLWNAQLGYYQYNDSLNYLMADAMIGLRYLDNTNIRPLLDSDRIHSHYNAVYDILVNNLIDTVSHEKGRMGAANVLTPDGQPGLESSEFGHHFEVWTGVTYTLSANMYHWGTLKADTSMQNKALKTAYGVYYQTWQNKNTSYWFAAPEAWRINNPAHNRGIMYQRVRSIWELLYAIDK